MTYFTLFVILVSVAGLIYFLTAERFKGWRTQLFAFLLTVLGGIVPLANEVFGYLSSVDWRSYLDKETLPFVVIGIGIMVALLRWMTTTPVGQK